MAVTVTAAVSAAVTVTVTVADIMAVTVTVAVTAAVAVAVTIAVAVTATIAVAVTATIAVAVIVQYIAFAFDVVFIVVNIIKLVNQCYRWCCCSCYKYTLFHSCLRLHYF